MITKDLKILLNKINSVSSDNFEYDNNYEMKKTTYYYINQISKNTYYCYIRENTFGNEDSYIWSTDTRQYILNPYEENCYQIKDIDLKSLIKAFKKTNPYSYNFSQFEKANIIFNYNIEDYLKNTTILYNILTFYSDIYYISNKYITKFFEPVYITDDFSAYLFSMYDNPTYCNAKFHYVYETNYSKERNEQIEIYKRITHSIYEYFSGQSCINPYTGEIVKKENNKREIIYEDNKHLIIGNETRGYTRHNIYYYKYNDIYVKADDTEKKEIDNVRETFKILSQG